MSSGKSLAVRRTNGAVRVCGETVRYTIRAIDARSDGQRAEDARRGRPAGHVLVLVPGHGQTVDGPRKLVTTAARLSRSKIAWCIDPVPTRGGDCTEAQAITTVTRQQVLALFPAQCEGGPIIQAIAIGWSHGGSEALRAAVEDPVLFPQYLGLCPTGLCERRPSELLRSFFLEAVRCVWASACHREWRCLSDTLRMGTNFCAGLGRDLWQGRSVHRLVDDVCWASRKVTGAAFAYPGDVGLVWGGQDGVIRWQDAFPGCVWPEEIAESLLAFRKENFPHARCVEVAVVDGSHAGPEAHAPTFLRAGLKLLGQLDERQELGTPRGTN